MRPRLAFATVLLFGVSAALAGCPGTLEDKARFEQAASTSDGAQNATSASSVASSSSAGGGAGGMGAGGMGAGGN